MKAQRYMAHITPTIERMFRAYTILQRTLSYQGLSMPDDYAIDNIADFTEAFAWTGDINFEEMSVVLKGNDDESCGVWWCPEQRPEKVGIASASNALQWKEEKNLVRCIIITDSVLTPPAAKELEKHNNVEIFTTQQLQYDIFDHVFVSKPKKMTAAEATAIQEEFHADVSKFPRLISSDPVSQRLGLKRNEGVQFMRKSTTSVETPNWRFKS